MSTVRGGQGGGRRPGGGGGSLSGPSHPSTATGGELRVRSGDAELAAHLALPPTRERELPGLVLCHGFPAGAAGASGVARSFPELADRIAREVGWAVLTVNLRGTGDSTGNFSLGGWLTDLHAAASHLATLERVQGVCLAGFGTGGALSICAGASRPDVAGVAALAAPADFDDWAGHPRRLLEHAREVGAIRDRTFPTSLEGWSRELRAIRPVAMVKNLAPRPLLVVHGSDDEAVPHFDARVVSDAHGSADLRIIAGAGHELRHDPRAVAVLLGWLDRRQPRA